MKSREEECKELFEDNFIPNPGEGLNLDINVFPEKWPTK